MKRLRRLAGAVLFPLIGYRPQQVDAGTWDREYRDGAWDYLAGIDSVAGLAKPAFTPPNWLFAPVWTTLYVLMGVASWRVWRLTGLNSPELILWMSQLTLNVLWSALFFSAHLILLALVEMALLWLLILVTMILFWQRDRIAGLLFVPYLAWVSFAFALNFAIWQLNGA